MAVEDNDTTDDWCKDWCDDDRDESGESVDDDMRDLVGRSSIATDGDDNDEWSNGTTWATADSLSVWVWSSDGTSTFEVSSLNIEKKKKQKEKCQLYKLF